MCKVSHLLGTRSTVRLAFAGLAAALLAGCADSSRFIGDPLGNPFHSAANAPVPSGDDREMAPPPPYHPSHVAIRSEPLAPPASAHRVADYSSPAHVSTRLAAGYNPPRTERTASVPAPSGHGSWSSEGGMAVIAATGDTAAVLAARYNVPESALLHENGFSSSAQVRPGTRLIIPVYSASGGGTPARRIAEAAPVHHDHAARERLLARAEAKPPRGGEKSRVAQLAPAREEAPEHGKMHWVKGPAPAVELDKVHGRDRMAAEAKPHGREKAMAKLEQSRAAKLEAAELKKEKQAELAEAKTAAAQAKIAAAQAKAARKMAKADGAAQTAANKTRVEPVRTAREITRGQPSQQVAQAEPAAAKKAAVDPTPTASLPPPEAEKPSANGAPEFRWPAHGRIIQAFKSGGNDGINIAVPEGTAVKAAESGVVAYAGSEIKGFGNLVLIRHPNGYVTAYANNGDIEVKRGEQVRRGQTIAKSGQSGNVASPQLHFELRKGSTPVDPTRYLAGL